MKVTIGKDEIIETDNHTIQELSQLRDLLLAEQANLKARIAHEKRMAETNGGVLPDSDLYRRLCHAKRKNGMAIEAIKVIVSDRRKSTNAAKQNALYQHFVEICRERMPRELFLSLMEEANNRIPQPAESEKERPQ